MKLLLLLILSTQYLVAIAQHHNKLKISSASNVEIDLVNGYTAKFTGDRYPFYKTIHLSIFEDSSGRINEEFFQYSDSCFAYIQYDSNHKEIAKGLVCINDNNRSYDTLSVPDIDKDPDLSKGIMKDDITTYKYFDKTGKWEEVESPLIIRRGKYEFGKRVGFWKVGYYKRNEMYPEHSFFPKEIFKVECIESYKDGVRDEGFQPDFSLPVIWDKLKGTWNLSGLNSIRLVQHLFTRQPFETMGGYTLTFEDTSHLKVATKNAFWKLNNGVIYYQYNKDEIEKYRIDYLSETELYLTPFPPEVINQKKRRKK